jgi:hypothetical protein
VADGTTGKQTFAAFQEFQFRFSSTIMGYNSHWHHAKLRLQRPFPSMLSNLPTFLSTILTLLTNKPHCVNDSGFDISQGASDIELYRTLNGGLESIQTAMKLFRKRNTDILVD